MAEYIAKDTALTAVADAIREKAGSSDPLAFPAGFVEAIAGISAGGGGGAASIDDFELHWGTFTPTEPITGTYEIEVYPEELESTPGVRLFFLFRAANTSDMGVISVGILDTALNSTGGAGVFGSWLGGTGTPVISTAKHTVSLGKYTRDRIAVITLNDENVPLTPHKYVWFDLLKRG